MEYNPPARIIYDMAKPSWKKILRGWLGLAAGVLTDLLGTILVSGAYILVLALQKASALAALHVPQAEIQTRLIREFYANWVNSLPMLLIGLTFSVLGGYLAGRVARYAQVGFGAGVGFGTFLVSIAITLIFRLPTAPAPFWKSFLRLALSLGACTLGGLLAYITRNRTRKSEASLENEIGINLKSGYPHSRFGMASVAAGILGFIGACASFGNILFAAFQKDHAASQFNASLAVIVFLGMLLPALIGAALGVIGLFERARKKGLAVGGFLLNAAVVGGITLTVWLASKVNIPR